ncbi:kelch-like protein 13 [Diadema antillarum]|uniref:kelch-like protein 13 n=1 Tax=Diadema antillarum TaxID=105358 RepID=UPI003A842E4C
MADRLAISSNFSMQKPIRPEPHRNHAPPPSRQYQCAEHSADVLGQLYRLWRERILCDGTIIANGRHFSVHRAVLASCSEYFRAIYMENDTVRDVQLHSNITQDCLELLLNYAYTSQIELTLENVRKVVSGAVQLKMHSVINICIQYLTSVLALENCIGVLHLSRKFNFKDLEKDAHDFIVDNFTAVAERPEFQSLKYDDMCFFLRQDRMSIGSEIELFKIGARWIDHDKHNRVRYAPQLMKHIRFPLIASDDLVEHVQSHSFMMEDPACHHYLIEALNYHLVPHRQHSMQTPRTRLRSTREVIVMMGGELPHHRVSNKVLVLDELNFVWKELARMPLKRVDHCVANLNHFLYVVGGQVTLNSNGKESIGTVHRFDPRFNKWLQMCPMQQRRAFFYLTTLNDSLVAIGGKNEQGPLASVEIFNPTENRWRYIHRLDEPTYAHSGTVVNNYLYITGGFASHNFSKMCYMYDHESDHWIPKCQMNIARGFHMTCSIRGMMYVMGGNHLNPYGDRVDVMGVERYDPRHDAWITMSPMLTGLSMAGCVATEDKKIFVIGGYNGLGRQREKDVHCYNVDADEWDVVAELPDSSLRMSCCTLVLPGSFFTTSSPNSETTSMSDSHFTSVSQLNDHRSHGSASTVLMPR